MTDSTPLRCADCDQPMARNAKSLPQGRARCHPCRRRRRGLPPGTARSPRPRQRTFSLTCAVCGKGMVRHSKTSLPQGQATCLECRRARVALRPKRSLSRVCPMCRRTFEHNRRTYCSEFCRTIGSRVGGFRSFIHMEGEYCQARWWVQRDGDPRWLQGPPRYLLDLWVTPNGEVRCIDCTSPMVDVGPMGHECQWCRIRAILLPTDG